MKATTWAWVLGLGGATVALGAILSSKASAQAVVLPAPTPRPGNALAPGEAFTGVPWRYLGPKLAARGLYPDDGSLLFGSSLLTPVDPSYLFVIGFPTSGGYNYMYATAAGTTMGGGSSSASADMLQKLKLAWADAAGYAVTVTG